MSFYLSRLNLRRNTAASIDVRGNIHRMHQVLMGGFPEQLGPTAREKAGLLFRVESSLSDNQVLVQSKIEPDWAQVSDQIVSPKSAAVRLLDPLLESLCTGQVYRFRLRANATRCVFQSRSERGKRVELFKEPDLHDWALRRLGQAGLVVCDSTEDFWGDEAESNTKLLRVQSEPKVHGYRSGKKLTFGSALFEGVCQIEDATLLRDAIGRGIGSGKSYGFGLLSLAPA